MKRIMLAAVCLTAAVATGYATNPELFNKRYTDAMVQTALRVRDNIGANSIPVCLALGTFLLTVIFHKARGKSLRESMEVAATRVTVVSVPTPKPGEIENPVVQRAKARATRTQLLTDQIGLQHRQRALPDEVKKAEKEVCYAEQAVAELRRTLAAKGKAHCDAAAKLAALRKAKSECEKEAAEIESELHKLADLV